MSEESAQIQSRLIRDLEPVVAVELDRHLSVQKNWYPHEYVPWSEGRDYAGPLNGDAWEAKDSRLTPVAQDSLVLNLLTEDNLPSYHTEIAISMGRDGAWGNWIERWTAEEARHAIVIRDYLMATRGVDPYQLEDLRMAHMSLGYQTPYENDMLHTIAYVSFQELATRISHRNTGKLSDDPIAEGMMQRVALDENLHMLFYRNTLSAALLAGIYDLQQHLDDVIAPVLRAWNVYERDDLSGDGLKARDELKAFMDETYKAAAVFNDKREVHFERQIARGIAPIRITN